MFHVPNQFRVREGKLGTKDDAGNNGMFVMQERPTSNAHYHGGNTRQPRYLLVFASDVGGWEWVSVHAEDANHKKHTPRWDEMQTMKELFWDISDVVVQFHPAKDKYVNVSTNTLSMWRLRDGWEDFLPMPPKELVG